MATRHVVDTVDKVHLVHVVDVVDVTHVVDIQIYNHTSIICDRV